MKAVIVSLLLVGGVFASGEKIIFKRSDGTKSAVDIPNGWKSTGFVSAKGQKDSVACLERNEEKCWITILTFDSYPFGISEAQKLELIGKTLLCEIFPKAKCSPYANMESKKSKIALLPYTVKKTHSEFTTYLASVNYFREAFCFLLKTQSKKPHEVMEPFIKGCHYMHIDFPTFR